MQEDPLRFHEAGFRQMKHVCLGVESKPSHDLAWEHQSKSSRSSSSDRSDPSTSASSLLEVEKTTKGAPPSERYVAVATFGCLQTPLFTGFHPYRSGTSIQA